MQYSDIVKSLGFDSDVYALADARLIYLIDAGITYALNRTSTHNPRLPGGFSPGKPGIIEDLSVCSLTPTSISFIIWSFDSAGTYTSTPMTYHGSYLVEWVIKED